MTFNHCEAVIYCRIFQTSVGFYISLFLYIFKNKYLISDDNFIFIGLSYRLQNTIMLGVFKTMKCSNIKLLICSFDKQFVYNVT